MAYISKYTGKEIDAGIEAANSALPKSGGTMSGHLILHGAPTVENGATTKKYVDDAVRTIASVPGEKGEDGVTFTPFVSPDGDLSWTNNGGLANPETVNIKGDKGSDATVTSDNIKNALGYTPTDVTDVFEESEQALFTNMLDEAPLEYGKILNTNGTVSDTATALCVTGYIPVVMGQIIRMKDIAIYAGGSARVCLYDENHTFITMIGQDLFAAGGNYYIGNVVQDANGNFVQFTVLKNSAVRFIRICTQTHTVGKNPVVTVNEEIIYQDGYGDTLNTRIKVDYSQIKNAPQKNGWSILPYERLNFAYSSIGRKPINTVEHFTDAAANYGYNGLKADVRPTSDGELVCCHDAGFTFDGNGYITTYDSANQTKIHDVTAAAVLGYSFRTGEHPCLVGDYLDVCRKYGKVAFVTIRNEYMDIVIPKLLEELRIHNMTYSSIINSMTYESLVQWRQQDQTVMINYTLNAGANIDQAQIDRAVGLGYCSLSGFGLNSSLMEPNHTCDFEYARANGIRLLQAIAYKEGSPEACYALGYDGCQIAYPWGSPAGGGVDEDTVQSMIDTAIGAAIGGAY